MGLWPCLGLKPGGQYKKRTRPTLDFSALPCHTSAASRHLPGIFRFPALFIPGIFRFPALFNLPASRRRPPFIETSRPSRSQSAAERETYREREREREGNARPHLHHQVFVLQDLHTRLWSAHRSDNKGKRRLMQLSI